MKAYLFIAVLCNSAVYGSQPLAPAHARKKSTLTKEQAAALRKTLGDDTITLYEENATKTDEEKRAKEKIGEFAVDFSFATRPSAKTVAKASPKSPSNKQ